MLATHDGGRDLGRLGPFRNLGSGVQDQCSEQQHEENGSSVEDVARHLTGKALAHGVPQKIGKFDDKWNLI